MTKQEKAHYYAKLLSKCETYQEVEHEFFNIIEDFKVWRPFGDPEFDLRGRPTDSKRYRDFPTIGVVDGCLFYCLPYGFVKIEFYDD